MKRFLAITLGLLLVGVGCLKTPGTTPVTVNGVTFDVPSEWTWLDYPDDESVRFETSASPYNVIEKIDIQVSPYEPLEGELIEETTDARIYLNPCGGALACYYVELETGTYEVYWNTPTSNQDPPDDLDGIWIPDHNVTREVILDVMRTFRIE